MLRLWRLWLAILEVWLVKVFKVIDDVDQKVKKLLLYAESKLACLEVVGAVACVVHLVDQELDLLDEHLNVGLRLWWQRHLVLNCLGLEVKHHYIFI